MPKDDQASEEGEWKGRISRMPGDEAGLPFGGGSLL